MVYVCDHVVWGKSRKEKERNCGGGGGGGREWGARVWWEKMGEGKKKIKRDRGKKQKGEEKK
jgi:hypothetical protein